MDFIHFLVTQYTTDRDLAGVGDELRDEIRLVRDGGFDGVRVGEHHVTTDAQYLYNEAALAFAANQTRSMTVSTGVCLLPYHHPVRIAEWGATMDVLTGGNFELGVGQGYRSEEFAAFGIDRSEAPGRLEEGIEIIKRLWTEDAVSFDGEYYSLDEVTINPKPLQEPRPPIVIGASNERGVRRAARISDGWWGAQHPIGLIESHINAFYDERGTDTGTIVVSREMFVADTDDAAVDAVKDVLMEKYAMYSEWGIDDQFEADSFASAWDELAADRFVVGSPDTVKRELERYAEIGVDVISPRMRYPGMTFADVRPALELFTEDVIPHFS